MAKEGQRHSVELLKISFEQCTAGHPETIRFQPPSLGAYRLARPEAVET